MSEILTYTEQCKNCQLCIPACPKNAIAESDVLNKKGYKIISVDLEKCVYCGICYRMCPDYVFEIR